MLVLGGWGGHKYLSSDCYKMRPNFSDKKSVNTGQRVKFMITSPSTLIFFFKLQTPGAWRAQNRAIIKTG